MIFSRRLTLVQLVEQPDLKPNGHLKIRSCFSGNNKEACKHTFSNNLLNKESNNNNKTCNNNDRNNYINYYDNDKNDSQNP